MTISHPKLPNFFIVGAPKAGTDALYYDLDRHPEIYMSPLKEPCYFSLEIRPDNFEPALKPQMQIAAASTSRYLRGNMKQRRFGGIVSEWEDYLRLFSGVKHEKAIGEGSVCYLWSKSAPLRIASAIPHAKIIIVLMNPAERAFHQYLKSLSDGNVNHSFREHLDACFSDLGETLNIFHPFLAFGSYAAQVKRYLEAFPSEQIHISLYDDAMSQRETWLTGIAEFLGVNPALVPRASEAHALHGTPKFTRPSYSWQHSHLWRTVGHLIPSQIKSKVRQLMRKQGIPAVMNQEDRSRLISYYRDDVKQLEEIIKRDLSSWIQ